MKRSTAVRHLEEMGETASEMLRFRNGAGGLGWPLTEMWVTGALLDDASELEWGSVVLLLDVPVEELPWLTVHPDGEWVGERLRLGKRPLSWSYRPAAWPAWNCRDRRVARFWSETDGVDSSLLDALRHGEVIDAIEPDAAALTEQLGVELGVARSHLRSVLDRYWDSDWRRSVRGLARPEDVLWRAATAVTELEAVTTTTI